MSVKERRSLVRRLKLAQAPSLAKFREGGLETAPP